VIDAGALLVTRTGADPRREVSGRGKRGRGHADFRDDLLRGVAKPWDFREALDGIVMRCQKMGHLLIEVAEMRLHAIQARSARKP
jgi:hypothetical protein